jgi:hypothetical protein
MNEHPLKICRERGERFADYFRSAGIFPLSPAYTASMVEDGFELIL